jgi:hypothetical protein
VAQPLLDIPRAKPAAGERVLAATLRGGAVAAFSLFLASVVLEVGLPHHPRASQAADYLRRAGAYTLLATPLARLTLAGVAFGRQGEIRYFVYAVGILALLGVALGFGFAA